MNNNNIFNTWITINFSQHMNNNKLSFEKSLDSVKRKNNFFYLKSLYRNSQT